MSSTDQKMSRDENIAKDEVTEDELFRYISFELADEIFAIKIEEVREVTHTPPISQMPRTPDYFEGVTNIRGNIVTILNLEKKLNLDNKIALLPIREPMQYTIVLDMKDYQIGFSVRKVPQTINFTKSEIEMVEEISKATKVNYYFLDGLGRKDGKLFMLLNIKKVFSTTDYKKITKVKNEAEKEKDTNIGG